MPEAEEKKEKNAAEIAAEKKEKAREELPGKPLEGDELNVVKEITETEAICGKGGCGAKAKIQVLRGNPDKVKFQVVRMACTRKAGADPEKEPACDWVSVPFEVIGLFCTKCGKSTLHGIPGGFFPGVYSCLACRSETPKEEVEQEENKVAVVDRDKADQEPM